MTFGSLGALLSIILMAASAEQQVPWFYAAWFVTFVISMALIGAISSICSIGLRRPRNKKPTPKAL